ncbi:MAG: hypothetical protein AB1938_10760 [Myxococcota bacterium]
MRSSGQHVLGIVLGAVLCVVGAGALFASDGPLVVGVVFLVLGLVFAGNGARHLLARSAFEQLEFTALRPVALGGTAELILSLIPKRPLTLTPGGSKVTLTCTEKAVYSAGTSSRTYTDVLLTQDQPLELPALLSQPFEQRLTVAVPPHLPPTWVGKHNSFVTEVAVRVDIDGWPDLVLQTELEVLPELEAKSG